MKLFFRLIAVLAVFVVGFSIVSCFTMAEDFLYSAVLNYPDELIERNMKTLDPDSSYSKRSAVLMTLLGDEEKMEELSTKYSAIVSWVLRSKRDNVVEASLLTENDPVRIFLAYPSSRYYESGEKHPVIFFAHGGGFTTQDFSVYESLVRRLANMTDCVVLFYEYRLAPKHKFPAAVNDTYAVYKWLMNDDIADCYGLDNSNVIFFGDSSGGNLISGLTIRIAENKERNARGVLLLYPSVDVTERLNYSRMAFSGIEDPNRYYVTSLKYLNYVLGAYLESKEDAYKPYASPLVMLQGLMQVEGWDNPMKEYAAKLELPLNLPEHLIAIPEIDTLKDEGKSYFALLKAFGVKADMKEYSGMFHGFLMTNAFVGKSNECLNDCVSFINRVLEPYRQKSTTYSETFEVSTVPVQ